MELRSDIILHGGIWRKNIDGYVGTFFSTQWELFKLCMSIGILYDHRMDDSELKNDEDSDTSEGQMTIPRTMFNRYAREASYFFKTAILTTNTVELSESDRLFLSFSEDIKEEEMEGEDPEIIYRGVSEEAKQFDKIAFLKTFANYGAVKLGECLSNNANETMDNLITFLGDSFEGKTEELIQMGEVNDLEDLEALDE